MTASLEIENDKKATEGIHSFRNDEGKKCGKLLKIIISKRMNQFGDASFGYFVAIDRFSFFLHNNVSDDRR